MFLLMSRVADLQKPDAVASASIRTGNRTAHAERIGEPGAVIRQGRDGLEMVNLCWGFEPRVPGGRPFAALRAEGRHFPSGRCLVPASEKIILSGEEGRLRVTLADGDWFYFAGVWREATRSWPASYALLTISANADLSPFRDRQSAVILRKDRMAWLEGGDEARLLRPLPKGSFRVERAEADSRQQRLLF